MIHYHGTPCGGTKADAYEFLKGRHALISFEHQQDLAVAMEVCKTFVLDNGAFTKWKKDGGRVDFNAYYDWVHSLCRHPGFRWCLIPDTIDGLEMENQDLVHKWIRRGATAKGIPVWHFHESLEWLKYLVENFEWVALGSSGLWPNPGTKNWWERMHEIMDVCCNDKGEPLCKLHGLRMMNPKIFTRLPLSSADSTNAARNSNQLKRFGQYKPPTRGQRAAAIADRIEVFNSSPIWIPNEHHQSKN